METSEIVKLATETAKASNTGLKLLDRVFAPWTEKRGADAKAQHAVQIALAQRLSDLIEGAQLTPEAYDLLITCGGKMSVVNLANILSKALPMLNEDADPSLISDDWIVNWRDKARLFSDDEMALLWAQLLANEANSPGSKSRKAVNVLADLEPEDAKLFRTLSDFRLFEMRTAPFTFLNQSQGGMCICRKSGVGLGVSQEGFGPCLQDRGAAALDLVFPAGQPGQEAAYPLLHRRSASQAQVPGRRFPRPSPDGFIGVEVWGVEVWAVARQIHQPQPQARPPQILPHRLATMGWGIIPNYLKRPRAPLAQLVQKGCRGSAVAVSRQVHPFHLSRLQTHRRIVAGFLAIPRTAGVHQGWLSPQHPPAPQLRIGTASARKWASSAKHILAPLPTASSRRAAYAATKASRFSSSACSSRFLGRLKANPKRRR